MNRNNRNSDIMQNTKKPDGFNQTFRRIVSGKEIFCGIGTVIHQNVYGKYKNRHSSTKFLNHR